MLNFWFCKENVYNCKEEYNIGVFYHKKIKQRYFFIKHFSFFYGIVLLNIKKSVTKLKKFFFHGNFIIKTHIKSNFTVYFLKFYTI